MYQKPKKIVKAKGASKSLWTTVSRYRRTFFSGLFLCLRNNRNSISDANTLLAGKGEIFDFHYNKEQKTYFYSVLGKKPLKYSDCIMGSSFHSSCNTEKRPSTGRAGSTAWD